jgi:thioredoxin-like negative regulator of GroEL
MRRFRPSRLSLAAAPGRGLAALLALVCACKERPASVVPQAGPEISATTAGAEDADDATADGVEVPELDEAAAPEGPAKRPPPSPVATLGAAVDALGHGNPEGAATFLKTALEQQPGDEGLRLTLAHALLSTGAYDDVEALLAERPAKAKTPSGARLRMHARLRMQRGDASGAEALLAQAIAQDAGDLAARGELLALKVAIGKGNEPATRAVMDALYDAYDAGKATGAEALVAVARAALARGTSGAFHDANMVLAEAERLPAPTGGPEQGFIVQDRVLLLRGAVFREKYAASEAADTYNLILARDAWQPDALAGMAQAHLEELRLAAAGEAAEAALQTNPRHTDAHGVLARIALIEGRRDEAVTRARAQILAIHPRHPVGLAVLAAAGLAADDTSAFTKARDEALAFSPSAVPFFLALSDVLVSMHLYEQTGSVLADATKRAPDDPYLQSAFGLNLLRLGKETEGRAALARAWKRDRFNERTRNTLDLYDQRIDPLYTDVERGDLRLRLPKEDAELVQADLIAGIERARAALDRRYGMHPGPLRIEVFSDPNDFSVRTIGVPSLGAVGVCFGDLITSVGPYRGTHNFQQVIWHELAHVYAVRLSRGRVPRWFTEGLSEWESELADPSWARESAELLAQARREGRLRKLGELDLAFLRATSPVMMEVAYSTAAWAMRYLGETHGLPKLMLVLKGYATGASTEALFKQHLGQDMRAVEAGFEAWMNARLDRTISGWQPSPRGKVEARDKLLAQAITEIRAKDYTTAARTLQQLVQGAGDGYRPRMLLGEVLLQGPQWKSAAPHFEKARAFNHEAIEPIIRLAELARRAGDLGAEKQRLREGLALDGMSFDPAARLTMLAVISDDADALELALERDVAVAPLHPMTLGARALQIARAGDKARAATLTRRALKSVDETEGRGPADTLVVLAIASEAAGERNTAKILATRASAEKGLPEPAKRALAAIVGAK